MVCEYTKYIPESIGGEGNPDQEEYLFSQSYLGGLPPGIAPKLWSPDDLRRGYNVLHLTPEDFDESDGSWRDVDAGINFLPSDPPEGPAFGDLTNSAPKLVRNIVYSDDVRKDALFFDQRVKQFLSVEDFYGKTFFNINKGKDVLMYAVMNNPYNKQIKYNADCLTDQDCGQGGSTNPSSPPLLVNQTMKEAYPNWPNLDPYLPNNWPVGTSISQGRYGALYTAGEARYAILNNFAGGNSWNFSGYYYAYPPGQPFLPGFTDVEFTTNYEGANNQELRYSGHIGAVLQDTDDDGIPDFIPTDGGSVRVEITAGNIMDFEPHMFGSFLRLSSGYFLYPELGLPPKTSFPDHTIYALFDGSRGAVNPINTISQEEYGVDVIPNQENPAGLYVGPDYEVFELNPTHMGKRVQVSLPEQGIEISEFSTLVISELIMIKAKDPEIIDEEYDPTYIIPDDVVQRVEGYMACKYGMQDKLPPRHPYKRFCPGSEPIQNQLSPDFSQSRDNNVPPEERSGGPFSVLGFFPLYSTPEFAKAASPTPSVARTPNEASEGKIGYHTHVLNGVTYYMPNGLDVINQQYHGNYKEALRNEPQSDRYGIYSQDNDIDEKNYTYFALGEDQMITADSLNQFQENMWKGISLLGDAQNSWQYFRNPAQGNSVASSFWNGATPKYPNKHPLGYAFGLNDSKIFTLENPIKFENFTDTIKVTFNEMDYVTKTRSLGNLDNGFVYPVSLSHKISAKENFELFIPKRDTGTTYVGLKVSQTEITDQDDLSLRSVSSNFRGTFRMQITFTGADFEVADSESDISNFEPVFYIDHINKKIRYMNNLLIANIT
jgi:hypothetical protein